MEIKETNQIEVTKEPSKTKVSIGSIIIGILMLSIPILVGVFTIKPELLDLVLASKEEIIRGMIIGVSILPVFLFVRIKGGNYWYKKVWIWGLITVACISVVGLTSMVEPTSEGNSMMYDMYQ